MEKTTQGLIVVKKEKRLAQQTDSLKELGEALEKENLQKVMVKLEIEDPREK